MLTKAEDDRASAGFSSFYKTRRRVYGALLLFVLAAGLPMATVPKLRDRLITRAWDLKEAIAGNRAPVTVQVGLNREPLPPEFQRPAPPPAPVFQPLPQSGRIYTNDRGGFDPVREQARAPSATTKVLTVPPPAAEEELAEVAESAPAAGENQPKYGQGTAERQAYALLVESNAAVAEIVKGNKASYKFKSWDAAVRGEDLYWVRLKIQAEGQPEGDYIWQVRLEAKQVTPLNYNARTIH